MRVHRIPVQGVPRAAPWVEVRAGEIRVFDFPLTVDDAAWAVFESVLDDGEIQRADRFAFPHLRRAFVTAHGTVRFLIAGLVGMDPADLRFSSGPQGKPACGALVARGLCHNLSHAQDRALLAVAQGSDLGVDIEGVRPVPDAREIATSHFHPVERAALPAGPPEAVSLAFLRIWVRKESYVKARGAGLSMDLQSFHADPAGVEAAGRWRVSDGDPRWRWADLDLGPRHLGAVTFAPDGSL